MSKQRVFAGKHTYGHDGIKFVGKVGIVNIGNFCSIASDLRVVTVGHNYRRVTTYPFDVLSNKWKKVASPNNPHPVEYGNLLIGSDVWIGYGVTIRSGVTIGHGSVIASKSVITGDVPPYVIVGGNPAKHIAYRFPISDADKLLKIRWWDWPDSLISERLDDIMTLSPKEFADKYLLEGSVWEPKSVPTISIPGDEEKLYG